MLTSEFFKKWYAAFASDVDPIIMREKVQGLGCCPWHIFTWGGIRCLERDDALKAYMHSTADEKVYVYIGYDFEDDWVETRKNDISELTRLMKVGTEIYIASLDFTWTFVWTHEGDCFGPYFLKNQI